jgi:hypothetical protein
LSSVGKKKDLYREASSRMARFECPDSFAKTIKKSGLYRPLKILIEGRHVPIPQKELAAPKKRPESILL